MAFIPLKDVLGSWLQADKFKSIIQERQLINLVNQYFQKNKKWPSFVVRAISFRQGRLVIQCSQNVISSELRLDELNFRKYLGNKIPQVKIKQIFYKIK